MHIDTNPSLELSEDHPITRELRADEARLYWSAVETMIDAAEIFTEYKEQNGKIDPADPELSEPIESLQDSVMLCELIEEAAIWRLAKSSPPKMKNQESNSTGLRSESNSKPEGDDE